VQLSSLPEWAQHVSAFFPGRYAVEAMQTAVTGQGLRVMGFSLLALLLIGLAGFVAGIRNFRWDAEQRFAQRNGKGWVAVALAAWAAVGLLAESRGRIGPIDIVPEYATPLSPPRTTAVAAAPSSSSSSSSSSSTTTTTIPPAALATEPKTSAPATPSPAIKSERNPSTVPAKPSAEEAATPKPAPPAATPSTTGPPAPLPEPASWRAVTPAHIDEIMFERLPSDSGVVSPIARLDEPLDPEVEGDLEEVRSKLATWGPGQVADPVQRVRNVLYVAAVPDVFQIPLERYVAHVVFERLQGDIPKDDLIKLLYWVATHPNGGDDSAVDDLRSAGLKVNGPSDMDQTRERVMLYALKLLGRLVGKIPQ